MLVQPFIENALKHGLLHKSPDQLKRVEIIFKMTDILTCVVQDNGVGRARAKEIKARQNTTHESFSVQAIRTRFEILKDHLNLDIGVRYEDLYENSAPIGTKVILRLPFKRTFLT